VREAAEKQNESPLLAEYRPTHIPCKSLALMWGVYKKKPGLKRSAELLPYRAAAVHWGFPIPRSNRLLADVKDASGAISRHTILVFG